LFGTPDRWTLPTAAALPGSRRPTQARTLRKNLSLDKVHSGDFERAWGGGCWKALRRVCGTPVCGQVPLP